MFFITRMVYTFRDFYDSLGFKRNTWVFLALKEGTIKALWS